MSEEIETPSAEAADPVAVSLALAGASRAKADAFLDDQHALIADQRAFLRDQRQHLHEQLKQIHLDVWEKRLGVLLRVATAFIGVAIAAAMAWLVWNAANSNALVIDAFAVPPDLAAKGLSGPVVAAKLSDKIVRMQAQTASNRPPRSYANSLADGLKLEIPETGVSLSELDNFLREQLGHDQHIRGELVQVEKGVALTARVGSDGSATVTGAEADMDALLQRLAEQIYRITQPYRYAYWVQAHGRVEEGVALLKALTVSGPDGERAWAFLGSGIDTYQYQSEYAGLALLRRGHALDPNNYLLANQIAGTEYRLGRVQDSFRDYRTGLSLVQTHGRDYTERSDITEHAERAVVLMYPGAFLDAVDQDRTAIAEGTGVGIVTAYSAALVRLAEFLAALHEPGAARAALVQFPVVITNVINRGTTSNQVLHARLTVAVEAQDWQEALTVDRELSHLLAQYPGFAGSRGTYFDPLVALALVHTGQIATAEARLKPMPADCYPCLIARAQVAALQKQGARADFWFARAAVIGPSLPFAESEWGYSLLERSKLDDAIVQFKIANQKGPHFADPLEGWGEALMAKSQSHLALAKFAEAGKYAPNWGRLHLKWGEALVYAGRGDEARAQFARAAALNLTPSEKSELAAVSHG
jgi:tetratricopeptide (TPR) repeat protein